MLAPDSDTPNANFSELSVTPSAVRSVAQNASPQNAPRAAFARTLGKGAETLADPSQEMHAEPAANLELCPSDLTALGLRAANDGGPVTQDT
jgi:hypothetical protein